MKQKVECKLDDIFEMRNPNEVDVPGEWMEKVKIAETLPSPMPGYSPGRGVSTGKWSYANSVNSPASNSWLDKDKRAGHYRGVYDAVDDFDPDYWGMSVDALPNDPLGNMIRKAQRDIYEVKGGDADSILDAAERRMAGESAIEGVESSEESGDPVGYDGLYELICEEHGPSVADAYHDIESSFSELAGKDELLVELSTAMLDLVEDDEGKVKALRRIFESMSSKQQAIIETNGF